ncbi:MAG: hypothetical protein AVDCRST_MAG76-3768, partial [uncultured Acidimicrobiales bacterium]
DHLRRAASGRRGSAAPRGLGCGRHAMALPPPRLVDEL